MYSFTERMTPTTVLVATLLTLAAVLPLTTWAKDGADGGQTSATLINVGTAPQTCNITFSDVHSTDHYYAAVRYLACNGVLGGYQDGTFRPGNPTTRGQLAKIEVLAKGWPIVSPPVPTFWDVPTSHTFYGYIETARLHNVLSGYQDGSFRPGNDVTRGQLAKIVVSAEGWPLVTPPNPTFSDVPPGNPFYAYAETAAARGVMGGYGDGSFRPGNAATRGQIAKIVYSAVFLNVTLEEQLTIDLINVRRVAMGLAALQIDASLVRAARRHSADIGPQGLCQHTGTDGSSPWNRIAQAGYTGFGRGEVIGCNFDTPLSVVVAWWASPGHLSVLTANDILDIGCGWWYTGQGTGWQTCVTGSR